ncbi:MAG: glycoside hydrolase family 15 [Candidatus Pacebacteria bacterium CG10_big_fil_rev_8_21_14_0_10_44_11]|nr:MAG: glycoside hydrolase family 15 [Candidatus Pacebacteria bacterium CG10_big_fil_rev_8_21_14_0_10_44_11]
MARALTLGNGTFLVCLDKFGFVRDMYFPYVGLENHVLGQKHRIGVWINNRFSWLDDGSWKISIGYKPETMVGYLVCKNDALKISVVMEDIVYNETNVFVRQVDIYNHSDQPITARLFFHQIFWISESKKRNTGFYDPTHNVIVHYKGRRVFIVNGKTSSDTAIDDYSLGAYHDEGKEGVFRDAEDGELSKNAVEHGSVDSVIRLTTTCAPNEKSRVYYWISVAKTLDEAYALNDLVLQKTPEAMLHSTESYWHAWLTTKQFPTEELPDELKKLFDTSLFILRCHTDNRGSIIASADSEMIEFGKDDYSYMWPRDAAFIVSTFCKAGFPEVTKPFFEFCKDVLHKDGYLHHRFRPDQSLGSTWHSTTSQREWLKDKILQLPIQEDESASVLVALHQYYLASKDLEFIEYLYKPLIEKIANFLVNFRDKDTGLPLPSYDLWEEKMGVSTYTCSAVYGGLMAAANFSEILDKRNHMRTFKNVAKEIKKAAADHLFSTKLQSFIRTAHLEAGVVTQEETIDASTLFGLWYFGMFSQDDSLFTKTLHQLEARLQNPSAIGGYLRYERDNYFKSTDLSNPWFITTLWEAQRKLAHPAASAVDLENAENVFQWVYKYRYQSGVLAEQLNPYTGQSLSATPLVWSHAVFIETVLLYLQKKKALAELDKNQVPLHQL